MPRRRTTVEWVESASGNNSDATATRSSESGNVHHVALVTASYTGDNTSGDLTIDDGNTTLLTVTVHEEVNLELPFPIKGSTNTDISATLSASGTADDVGNVAIGGFTRNE